VAAIVLGTGATLAFVWFILGGLPFTNHAAYGRVPVPGDGTLTLPSATVRISFEEDGVVGEDDSAEMPSDLVVVVTGSGGDVPVSRLSENLFSSTTGSTGFVPYGDITPPTAGSYLVTTSASQVTSAVSPRVTFGDPPFNPFGPAWLGALIILAPFAIVGIILLLPLRRA
jgi:hypothetical protein